MKKSIIVAGAASVALAAMPVLGVFATDDQSATDTIEVTVTASCTFSAGGDGVTYAVENVNGRSVSPIDAVNSSNTHLFTVFCNNNSGYKVSATATDLTQSGVTDRFAYKATLPSSGADSAWHAAFTQASGGALTLADLDDSAAPSQGADPVSTKDIATLSVASGASGESFTATYTAYIGTETPAGTYSGEIAYTLTPNS